MPVDSLHHLGRQQTSQTQFTNSSSRPPFSQRPEEGVRRLRLPLCQDPQVYVQTIQRSFPTTYSQSLTNAKQSTGARRPSAERPSAPAAPATSRMFHGDSRTASRPASPREPAEPSSRSKAAFSFIKTQP